MGTWAGLIAAVVRDQTGLTQPRYVASESCAIPCTLTSQDIRRSSLAYEAAFNLMLIYGASGSTDLVRQKSKWLAI